MKNSSPIPPERLPRALSLLSYLLDEERGERVSLAAIQADLGLAPREVEEDIRLLNLMNYGGGTYVIYAEIEGDAVVVTREVMAEPHARPARLSPLMARALLLALDLLGDTLPVEGGHSLASARKKVEALVRGLDLPATVAVDDLVATDAGVTGVLNRALHQRRLVRLEYFSPSREELSERLVEPYLLFHSGNAWYLEAYCLHSEGQRTFRLDLIRAAEASERSFTPRPDVDLSSRRTGSLAPASPPRWAVLRFPAVRRHMLEEQGYAVEDEEEEGTVRARIPYLDGRWLVREVLRHAGEAVLEEPAELRAEVARLAAELLAGYQPGATSSAGVANQP